MMSEVQVSIPPQIAGANPDIPMPLVTDIADAAAEIAALDSSDGDHLEPLAHLLLRTESVASSKIERIEADLDDYARALHGSRSNDSATSMAAATAALDGMIRRAGRSSSITAEELRRAHGTLMAEDPHEAEHAGTFRPVQNWIGGSDHSPRGAMFVPPPPEMVDHLMDDLLTFANRGDLPPVFQAAIAHAQFESIHPFTDGNGRIGRSLINAVLRRSGTTRKVVVPLAAALVDDRLAYFSALDSYRAGDAGPIVSRVAAAGRVAASESRRTANRIAMLPEQMREMVGPLRTASAASSIIEVLLTEPIITIDEAEWASGVSTQATYGAIDRLVGAGVLRPLTARRRNQVWGAAPVLDELEDLGLRIAAAARRMG